MSISIRRLAFAAVALALSICFVAGAQPAHAGEPTGLVSRWRGDGNTNDELAVNNGTAVGNVTYAAGALGQGFQLDGASYVQDADSTLDSFADAFTVTAWIRMDSFSSTASVINLRTNANTSGFTLEQLFGVDGTMTFAVNQSGVFDDYPRVDAPGFSTGVLYHVAATFDAASGSIVIYRDGKPVASRRDLPRRPMAIAPAGDDDFQIGHNIRATGAFWRGLIDDVRFYGRALSPAEVASIAAPTSLVAHWRFDEPAGATIAKDDLGTYPGTLAGGAAFAAGGIAGNCVSLDEATSSLVNMGTSFPGFTSGDYSIVGWVKTTTTANDTIVLGKHEAFTQNGYFVNVNLSGGGGQTSRATFYASEFAIQSPNTTTVVTDGNWHQIVGVYRAGGQHSIYVDGAPAEASTASNAMVANGAPFLIGAVNVSGSPASRYTGLVDDVQLYASALTDAQIDYLFSNPGRPIPDVQFDLRTDWSDTVNPNGAWIYREGANALPRVTNWGDRFAEFSSPRGAWARTNGGNTFLPGWFKDTGTYMPAHDWLTGDVIGHTTDSENGVGSGPANVVWRSPFAGVVDVSGSVWMGREIGRSSNWAVLRNGTQLTSGAVASGDPFSRAIPVHLSSGAGGPDVLKDIAVIPGDEIRLEYVTTSQFGDFVGTNFAVNVAAGRRIVTFFLPRSVKLKLAGPGQDSLTVAGTFDDGGAALDLAQPVTFDIGGYSTGPLTLDAKGKHKTPNLSLAVRPRAKGSSRGTFKLTLKRATLAGLIGTDGEVELHFRAAGLADAAGRVRLGSGSFTLGRVRGSLVLPQLSPASMSGTANVTKSDALSFTARFSADVATTDLPQRVRVALGRTFDVSFPGSAFTAKGTELVHTAQVGSGSITVTLDRSKERISVKSKGIEVGALTDPTADLTVDVGTGPVTVKIRLATKGTKRSY